MYWCIALISLLVILCIVLLYLNFDKKRKSKNRDNFFYHAIHEMKNPLSTIRLTSEMLHEMETLPDDAQRLIKMIITENKRVSQSVELFLHFAKIERDELLLHREPVNIHALLEDSLLIHEFILEQENGILKTAFEASDYVISGDKLHLTNVFDNLLENARKYSDEPASISVNTRNEGKCLIVSVTDKGVGIDPGHHKDVFKQFYRAPGTNNNRKKGFGMGLYYVKYVIEKHGGHIILKSQPGEGSCFEVSLPLTK